jgi:hypothetical protein
MVGAKRRGDWRLRFWRPRFSLWAMLVLITLAAIPLGYVARRRAHNQRRAKAYEKLHANGVNFHYQTSNAPATTAPGQLVDFWRFLTYSKPNELVSTISIANYRTASGESSISDEDLQAIALFPETLQIDVNASRVSDRGLEVLRKLPNLFCLNLTSSPQITGAVLEKIGPHPSLRTINLTNMDQFDGKYLAAMEQFPNGLTLYINGCKSINDETTRSVALPKNVKFLYLRYSSLGDEALSNWLKRAKLWSLEIDAKVTRKIAPALATQTNLSSLTIFNAPLVDDDFLFLAQCKHLGRLRLNGLPIQGEFLKSLPDEAALENLGLGYTLLTDKNAVEIFRLKKLVHLDLEFTTLTGEFVKEKSPQPTLKAIHLCGVQFDESGKAALVKFAQPTLQISLPQNWTVEDISRFPSGKPGFSHVSLNAQFQPSTGIPGMPNCGWYSGTLNEPPIDRSPVDLMKPILRLHQLANPHVKE